MTITSFWFEGVKKFRVLANHANYEREIMCCWRLQPPWDVGATVSRGLDLKTHRGEKSTNRWMDLDGQDRTGQAYILKVKKLAVSTFHAEKWAGKVRKLQQKIFGTNIRKWNGNLICSALSS